MITFDRSVTDTRTTMWYLYMRNNPASSQSLLDGSFDSTSTGWTAGSVIKCDADTMGFVVPISNAMYWLAVADDGVRKYIYSQAYTYTAVRIAAVSATLPVSVSSTVPVSQSTTVVVSSTGTSTVALGGDQGQAVMASAVALVLLSGVGGVGLVKMMASSR